MLPPVNLELTPCLHSRKLLIAVHLTPKNIMTNQQPSLRFDHREIAVIFSLFVFVSLLMFTVGILVGKGLAQAKYESSRMIDSTPVDISRREPPVSPHSGKSGSSVTTD